MTEPRLSARPSPHRTSSALAPASTSDVTSIRPRNRRLASTVDNDSDAATSREASRSRRGRNLNVHDTAASPSPARSYGLLAAFSPTNSRSASPLPTERSGASPHRTNSAANLTNFFNDSLTQSWASIQGFTSSLISSDNGPARRSQSHNRAGSRPGTWGRDFSSTGSSKKTGGAWGPAPPRGPNLNDVGTGSQTEREDALKAARRAMVLESHDGVNGGLDVSGKHKRRNSDESVPEQPEPQEYLVYIHKVQPNDTYAGLILRYQCREDAFRKANGLWTRDSIQVRKWLTIPVDACDVRGRPCDPPSWHNAHGVDLLAPTPAAEENTSTVHDFFSQPTNGTPSATQPSEEEENPWTHVRWVKIDSFPQPVEIARVARNAMGYFPPRRKKSIRTVSTFSTPRQSLDLYSNPPGSAGTSSRRQSSLGHRPQLSGTVVSSPGRGAISEGGESLPAWMRRPGGVGSMGMGIRAPGPDKDYLTTWTKKHLPGLTLEGIPSMSIMGSETAHFGFKSGESSSIVENPSGERQDVGSTQQGNGLDKAAAAVETWLRGALSRKPSSQLDRIRGMPEGSRPERNGDLIELTDTGSDDGQPSVAAPTNLMESLQIKSGSRSEGEGGVRGRMVAKGGKDD
ncbi:hypothetical protein F53441_9884 [Fusarium austroafricanum]|uniref:LysM domain-containing protein n=1 Tax=Fusarium austroafricanum TaxID=2364996 RepID=A0A8H4KA39_9HYPO|nr:hypothetical protein F53441_9884 [Fusarium austroafricanum]